MISIYYGDDDAYDYVRDCYFVLYHFNAIYVNLNVFIIYANVRAHANDNALIFIHALSHDLSFDHTPLIEI